MEKNNISEILSSFRNLSKEEQGQAAALIMGQLVNTFSQREASESFISSMNREHRTLQQSFTKLMFEWLEFAASDQYRTDARNEDSKKYSRQIVDKFKEETGFLPSDYLRMI